MKHYTLNDISCILTNYINENKNKNSVDYLETIETLKGLIIKKRRISRAIRLWRKKTRRLWVW